MQLEVQTTGVAHSQTFVIPPPQRGGRCMAVHAERFGFTRTLHGEKIEDEFSMSVREKFNEIEGTVAH